MSREGENELLCHGLACTAIISAAICVMLMGQVKDGFTALHCGESRTQVLASLHNTAGLLLVNGAPT